MKKEKIRSLDDIIKEVENCNYIDCHKDEPIDFDYQYENILYYLKQCKKQQEIINKIEEKIKENIKNAKYEITTLTITDRVYYKYIDDMLNELLEILEDKEV